MQKRIKKFIRKKFNKAKEKELPSFLLDLEIPNEKVAILQKKDSNVYLGPLFFGCEQYHPPFYSLNLADAHQPLHTASHKENILEGILLPKPVVERHEKIRKLFHPIIKHRKVFTDLYPHKCPGHKKIFKPEVAPPILDLGETESVVEGETSREIPIYWLKKASCGILESEFELVTLSDIKERKRALLPYNERIAHTHFPKEFVSVRVIGPTIPAAITINKIRSKREYETQTNVPLQSVKKKTAKENNQKVVENKIIEEVKLDSPSGILPVEEEKMESMESKVFEEDEHSEQYYSEMEVSVMSFEEENWEEEMSIILSEKEEEDERSFEDESEIEN